MFSRVYHIPYNGESDNGSDLLIGKTYTSKSHVCNKTPLSSYTLNRPKINICNID